MNRKKKNQFRENVNFLVKNFGITRRFANCIEANRDWKSGKKCSLSHSECKHDTLHSSACETCDKLFEKQDVPQQDVPRGTKKRISKDEYYLNIALAVSKRSTCLKRHYGCVIVKDDVIIATGYNGSPRGEVNCCDTGECKRLNAARYSDYTECMSVHAEQNALISADFEKLMGATVYLACENNIRNFTDPSDDINIFVEDGEPKPCPLCSRMLKNARVGRIVNRNGEIVL